MVDEIKNINGVNVSGSPSTDFTAGQTAENKLSIFEEIKRQYEAQLGRTLTPEETANLQAALQQGKDADAIAKIFGFEKSQPTETEVQEPVVEETTTAQQEAQNPVQEEHAVVPEKPNFFASRAQEVNSAPAEVQIEAQPEVHSEVQTIGARFGRQSQMEVEFVSTLSDEEKFEYEQMSPKERIIKKQEWLLSKLEAGQLSSEDFEKYINDALEVYNRDEIKLLKDISYTDSEAVSFYTLNNMAAMTDYVESSLSEEQSIENEQDVQDALKTTLDDDAKEEQTKQKIATSDIKYYNCNNLPDDKDSRMDVVAELRAKNKFLYSEEGKQQNRTEEDWNNLDAETKGELISESRRKKPNGEKKAFRDKVRDFLHVNKKGEKANESTDKVKTTSETKKADKRDDEVSDIGGKERTGRKDGDKSDFSQRITTFAVLDIETANRLGIPVEDFYESYDSTQQEMQKAQTLQIKYSQDPNSLTEEEKVFLKDQLALVEAVQSKLNGMGIETSITFQNVYEWINNVTNEGSRINVAEALRDYLKNIPDNELSPKLLETKRTLNAPNIRNSGKTASRYGQQSKLDKKFISTLSDEEKFEYEHMSPKRRIMKKQEWLFSKLKTGELSKEDVHEYLDDALEVFSQDEIDTLWTIIVKKREYQRTISNSDSEAIAWNTMDNMKAMGDYANVAFDNANRLANGDAEQINDNTLRAHGSATGRQIGRGGLFGRANATGVLTEETQRRMIIIAQSKTEEAEDAQVVADEINTMPQKVINESLDGTVEIKNEVIQDIYFTTGVEGNAESAKYATEKGIPAKLHVANQVKAMRTTDASLDLLPEEEAIKYKIKLDDLVPSLAVQNQKPAHEIFANSKYTGVAEHAAANIYKLDQSVQAEAFEISYKAAQESGNTKVLDALRSNYSQLDPEVRQTIASNPTYTQALSESTINAIASDTTLDLYIEIESNARLVESGMENWKLITSDEKYEVLKNMPGAGFYSLSPAIRRIILEHAKNDPTLMHALIKNVGIDLLDVNCFTSIRNIIVREMLNDPSMRLEVAEKVKELGKGKCSDTLYEECLQVLAEKENIDGEDFDHLSELEKREALSNPTKYSYELGSASQSGTNRNNIPQYEDKYGYYKTNANLRGFMS